MLRVFQESGSPTELKTEWDTVEVKMSLNPVVGTA